MIPRYTRPEMARIWSDENRFRTWLAVEVAATETLAEAQELPNLIPEFSQGLVIRQGEFLHAADCMVPR